MAKIFEATKKVPVMQDGRDCHARPIDDFCHFKIDNPKGVILNIGDSHADMFGPAILEYAQTHNYDYVHMTGSGCVFVLDSYP